MPTFDHNDYEYVARIRDLLKHGYGRGFTIIKELAQNANDAEATELHIGWIKGLGDSAENPLLRGPALFAVNNGRFLEQDSKAIRRFGLGTKANEDRSTIGRFGLGLKSVFHHCEAFFYFSSQLASEGEELFGDLLNPWAFQMPEGWEIMNPTIKNLVRQALAEILPDPWFCLWIPLRRAEHCPEGHEPLFSCDYTGEGDEPPPDIFDSNLGINLALLLPQLWNLERITIWNVNERSNSRILHLEVDSKSLSGRISRPEDLSGERSFGGEVVIVKQHGDQTAMPFGGRERSIKDHELEDLFKSDYWPNATQLDNSKREQKRPIKAWPNAAVTISKLPEPEIRISESVYLPTRDLVRRRLSGTTGFAVLMNGYYFLPSNREQVHFGDFNGSRPCNVQEVEQAWNKHLLERGVLPELLPALDVFCKRPQVTEKDRIELTRELENVLIDGHGAGKWTDYASYQSAIFRDYQWAYCLDHNKNLSWRLVDDKKIILPIPDPPDDQGGLAYSIFGALLRSSPAIYLSYSSYPRLCRRESTDWSANFISQVVDGLTGDQLTEPRQMQYLNRFLSANEICCDAHVEQSIGRFLIRILSNCGYEGWQDLQPELIKLVRRISNIKHMIFDIETNTPDKEIVARLQKGCPDIPLLPKRIAPDGAVGCLTVEQAVHLLEKLQNLRESISSHSFPVRCAQLALQILQAVPQQNREQVRSHCGEWPLFRASHVRLGRTIDVTWSDLDERLRFGLLFRGDSGRYKELQKALAEDGSNDEKIADEDILRIDKQTADILLGGNRVSTCTLSDCLDVLLGRYGALGRPTLAKPPARRELLGKLLSCPDNYDSASYRQALRYLLYGHVEAINGAGGLYYETPAADPAPWGKLMTHCLKMKNAGWRVLDSSLAEVTPHALLECLNLMPIGWNAAFDLLMEVGPEHVDGSIFSPNEREQLITHLAQRGNDWRALLRALPIHEEINFDNNLVRLTSIDDNCCWKGARSLDGFPPLGIRLLRLSNHSQVKNVQMELAPELDLSQILDRLLSQDEPVRHWSCIMDLLGGLNLGEHSSLQKRLRQIAWLPSSDPRFASIKLNDLIHLEGLEDETDRLLAGEGAYVTVHQISAEVKQHPQFSTVLMHLVSSPQETLETLALALEANPAWQVGPVEFESDGLAALVEAFGDQSLLRVIPLLKSLLLHPSTSQLNLDGIILTAITKDWPAEVPPEHLLEVLREIHEQCSSARVRSQVMIVYKAYLRAVMQCFPLAEQHRVIRSIQLLNKDGKWKPTGQLCLEAEGITDTYIVQSELGNIIRPAVPDSGIAHVEANGAGHHHFEIYNDSHFKKNAKQLQDYFHDWQRANTITRQMIGGLLALLGSHPEQVQLANKFLSPHDREAVLRHLRESSEHEPEDETTPVLFERVWMSVSLEDGARIPVISLAGGTFNANLSEIFDHLMLGQSTHVYTTDQDRLLWRLKMRWIDPVQNEHRLEDLLRRTIEVLLVRFYRHDPGALDLMWSELSKTDQLDVRVTQALILDSAPALLRELSLQADDQIAAILEAWDEARRLKAQEENIGTIDFDADAKLKDARRQLREYLEEAEPERGIILEAVRRKISDYQYDLTSIPFEMFQNADDASVERKEIEQALGLVHSPERKFVVRSDSETVCFIHWGRPINYAPATGFDEARQYRFAFDLEKMLMFSASDKVVKHETNRVTGKFGLGFKSVHLVSRAPWVLSHQLAFRITGGLYPVRIPRDDLIQSLGDQASTIGDGTVIGLDLKDTVGVVINTKDILERFRRQINILLAFAKEIRYCEFWKHESGELLDRFCWREQAVEGASGVVTGRLEPLNGNGCQALKLTCNEGSLLLALDGRGPANGILNHYPTLWVTTPTTAECGLNFCLNAPFSLDIGRNQLALRNSSNPLIAQCLGEKLGDILIRLYDNSQKNWAGFAQRLNLAPGLEEESSRHNFWTKMFECLGNELSRRIKHEENDALNLIRKALWDSTNCGYLKLVLNRPCLPSGIPINNTQLLQVENEVYGIDGCLDDDAVYNKAKLWPAWSRQYSSRHVVSMSRVGDTLKILAGSHVKVHAVTLRNLLEKQFDQMPRVKPDVGAIMGQLLTRDFLQQVERDAPVELAGIKSILKELHFLGCDDDYHLATDLLLLKSVSNFDAEDEILRAQFAPSERVLSDQYDEVARAFFLACRSQMQADAQELVRWGIEATGERRDYFRKYILFGGLGNNIRYILAREGLEGTWLDVPEIRNSLSLQYYRPEELDYEDVPLSPPPPETILENLRLWWSDNREEKIRDYEDSVYPQNSIMLGPDYDPDNYDHRRRWMTLFMLGAFYGLGRTQMEQGRSFLTLFDERGWLGILSGREVTAQEYVQILNGYLEEQIQATTYSHYMRLYVSFYQMSRWLDEYIELFRSLNRQRMAFSMDLFLTPRASPIYQGGISAPPLLGALGFGACFVLRELVRHGVLPDVREEVLRHCYVPTGRLRRVCNEYLHCNPTLSNNMSRQSKVNSAPRVHALLQNYLTDPTFGNDFDLPLQCVIYNDRLFQRFFGGPVPIGEDEEDE